MKRFLTHFLKCLVFGYSRIQAVSGALIYLTILQFIYLLSSSPSLLGLITSILLLALCVVFFLMSYSVCNTELDRVLEIDLNNYYTRKIDSIEHLNSVYKYRVTVTAERERFHRRDVLQECEFLVRGELCPMALQSVTADLTEQKYKIVLLTNHAMGIVRLRFRYTACRFCGFNRFDPQ